MGWWERNLLRDAFGRVAEEAGLAAGSRRRSALPRGVRSLMGWWERNLLRDAFGRVAEEAGLAAGSRSKLRSHGDT
ncbi:hypothetical protein GCM10007160_37330 [Litchfieldella qijiaojingensis]|uniref:Transposase n=1 Tax=Litchfieldella qijiaojingensis TaxID=980347 RepID=A0ABQ2Z677_9GAMM|nr:hypothetical protein GCM10007160_37330 [Halomonas qijiaojingensis]